MAKAGERPDWVGNWRSYLLVWGWPSAALVAAIFASPPLRTGVWTAALVWMGAACLINARRCGRTHCFFTGPFLLFMAILVFLHGSELIWLGGEGWLWLFVAIFVGRAAIWIVTERVWGRFRSAASQ